MRIFAEPNESNMSEAFRFLQQILSTNAGSFAFVIGILFLMIWITHWVTKKITEIESSHKYIEKENQQVSDSVRKICGKIESDMDEIRRDISCLKGIVDVFRSGMVSLEQSHSPMSLTDLGVKVAKELNAEEMIQRNWDVVMKDIEENAEGKTPYDIQEYCRETAVVELGRFLLAEDVIKLKDTAYREGKPLAYYAPIISILIRDKYLQEKNLMNEVDKTVTTGLQH